MIHFLSDISQINPIDSIAKHINPQADLHNTYWWIAAVIVVISGIVYFVIKHFFKGLVLDRHPKPLVRFQEGNLTKDTLYLSKAQINDIEETFKKKYKEALADIDKQYPTRSLDPYQDMRLLFKDALQAASDYNADVESYKEGMKEYYSKTIRDELMLDCLKMVSFSLYAKGRKACGKLIIELSFAGDTDHVFIADSRQIKKGKHDVAPEKNDAKIRDAFDFFFPNDQEEYEYGEWNLIRVSKKNSYSCAELISGNPNNDVIT